MDRGQGLLMFMGVPIKEILMYQEFEGDQFRIYDYTCAPEKVHAVVCDDFSIIRCIRGERCYDNNYWHREEIKMVYESLISEDLSGDDFVEDICWSASTPREEFYDEDKWNINPHLNPNQDMLHYDQVGEPSKEEREFALTQMQKLTESKHEPEVKSSFSNYDVVSGFNDLLGCHHYLK